MGLKYMQLTFGVMQKKNEYSKNDKKAIDAGACKYLNFIAIVLKKK